MSEKKHEESEKTHEEKHSHKGHSKKTNESHGGIGSEFFTTTNRTHEHTGPGAHHKSPGEHHKSPNEHHKKESDHEYIAQIEKIMQENAELKNTALRLAAEMENMRKMHVKDIESANRYGTVFLLKEIVDPYEQLFMAISAVNIHENEDNQLFKSLIDGINMTKQSFEKVLSKHGLKRIFPKNEIFDHNKHQAVSQVNVEGGKSNVVIDVIQAGYILHDRVIRPAMVVVSM